MLKTSRKNAWAVQVNDKYYVIGSKREAEYVRDRIFNRLKNNNCKCIVGILRTSEAVKMSKLRILNFLYNAITGTNLDIF